MGQMEDYGCDMRGMLSFQILWPLSKRVMNGEELAEEIEKRRGEKPKAGTIYPALKSLSEKNLVKGSRKGKAVYYALTPAGSRVLGHAVDHFCSSFGEILRDRRKV